MHIDRQIDRQTSRQKDDRVGLDDVHRSINAGICGMRVSNTRQRSLELPEIFSTNPELEVSDDDENDDDDDENDDDVNDKPVQIFFDISLMTASSFL